MGTVVETSTWQVMSEKANITIEKTYNPLAGGLFRHGLSKHHYYLHPLFYIM